MGNAKFISGCSKCILKGVFFFVSNDLYVLLLKQTLKQNKKQKQKVTNRVTKQRLAHDSIWGWICHG